MFKNVLNKYLKKYFYIKMENQTQTTNDSIKKAFVPKKESTRYNKETGKYDHRPIDPEYFNKYYHDKNSMVPCEICNKTVGSLKMYRHIKTKKCQMARRLDHYETSLKMLEEKLFQAIEILEKNI